MNQPSLDRETFEAGFAGLDAMDRATLDALPFGVIELDDAGRVTFYNAAESHFSGRPADRVVGRHFFREVAPCTHLPQFHGRFLEGVRAGALDARFEYVFGFEPAPVRVEVRLRKAAAPGRWWMGVRPIGEVAPSRHRQAVRAVEAVERRSRAEVVDPSVCEREPIHTPGAVQPHAVMLAADPVTLVVQACSENVGEITDGRSPAEVLGRSLEALPMGEVVSQVRAASERGAFSDPSLATQLRVRLGGEGSVHLVTVHAQRGRLILEFEREPERPEDFGAATGLDARAAVARVRAGETLEEVARSAAADVRAMTGFQRVLVYRFDPDWNGEAVAESTNPDSGFSALIGLRFPASDIPAQARALYTRSPPRFVVDRDAVPAAVLAEPQSGNQSVDLSFAHSRALSPVHLEYQRNLGVNGSMSISIVVDGRLWGLVIGHHRRPHYVTPETRALATVVAEALALRIHELETMRAWREQQATLAAQNALLRQMAAGDDFISALTSHNEATLLDLLRTSGAAIVTGRHVETLGWTPAAAAVLALADWLRETLPEERLVFASGQLAAHYAPAEALRDRASGLLAVFVGERREHLLMWFRPEVAATVAWGGDPSKPVLAEPTTATVLPRRSFERWVEERRGFAEPWAAWQVRAAEVLSHAIEGVVLRQGRRIRELTENEAELTRAIEQKDLLAREVDHRVKNSLQIVAGIMLMQARGVADPQARAAFQETYGRVMSVARVHDMLHLAEDLERVDLGETMRRLCADLAVGMAGAERRLEVAAAPGLMASSRVAVALALIATELVTNALKYAYAPDEPGEVIVKLKAAAAGGLELRVCDEGRGLPPDWGDADPARPAGGLGMRVIRALLQPIEAELDVEPTDPGVCFIVRTPAEDRAPAPVV